MKKMILFSLIGLSANFTSAQRSAEFSGRTTGNISAVNYSYKAHSPDSAVPFWKRFSMEGAIGRSTYRLRSNGAADSMGPLFVDRSLCRHSLDARLGINYHFDNGLSLQTGLEYSSAREQYQFGSSVTSYYTYQDTVSVYYDPVQMDSVYVVNPVSFGSTHYYDKITQNYYQLFTVPFQLGWKTATSSRTELEFALGGSISVYGENTGIAGGYFGVGQLPTSEAYRTKGILSLGGSIKYLHRIGLHHAFYIEPWARLGISNVAMPVLPYTARRNHYGIRVGYRFYFDSRKHN
jgi:hypothetical protein